MKSERLILPGYSRLNLLHRGNTRLVYRARKVAGGEPVILKTGPQDPGRDGHASLKREASILGRLTVRGVPRPLGLEMAGSRPILVLEDLGGDTLAAVIRADSLALSARVRVGSRIAGILREVHEQGIIHRDLNPNNILVELSSLDCSLIDFELATERSSPGSGPAWSQRLEGTPAYLSPEQTGRTPWEVDYRTDLYSLGVSLYELFTGKHPFGSRDALQVVHAHLAVKPKPLHTVQASIPPVLGEIVLRLMAKTPEERYQSAAGLEADLERCAIELEETGRIAEFPLGSRDVADRLAIPHQLYGRERELADIKKALSLAQGEKGGLLLVAGYAGIGKTSLILELDGLVKGAGGRFISGKFDQFVRGTPYTAFRDAFSELARQLLTESDPEVSRWRRTLHEALGTNGQVILDLIPDFEPILGPQPPVPQLGPAETLNRFNRLFQEFLAALAGKDRPLVLFLDDLQWVDSASLELLRVVLSDGLRAGLLVVGAYRDNEVGADHELMELLSRIDDSETVVTRITLAPLDADALLPFVVDTLRSSEKEGAALANLLGDKTGGNPFFMGQFMKSLAQENLIRLDRKAGLWTYDLEGIRRQPSTDNVVELLAGRIGRLSPRTRTVLEVASCLGNRFDERTLAVGCEGSPEAIREALAEAGEEGLVLREGGVGKDRTRPGLGFRFLHDRVQQAAYALIPESRRPGVHLQIGRSLFASLGPNERTERAFELIDQIRFGLHLVDAGDEARAVFDLAVTAGGKARDAAAYAVALEYFQTAGRLLGPDSWDTRYAAVFDLHLNIAECQYLCGRFDDAFASLDRLERRAASPLDAARVQIIRAAQYETMGEYANSVEALRKGLAPLGVEIPDRDHLENAVESEMDEAERAVRNREIASLIDLPPLSDPTIKMSMRLLAFAWAPSYILADTAMISWIPARMVRLSLEHGNTEESAVGYVVHGFSLGTRRGEYKRGRDFGLLGLELNGRLDDARLRGKLNELFGCFVNLWRRPLSECIESQRTAFLAGIEGGDFAYGSYGGFVETWYGFLTGDSLADLEARFQPTLDFLIRIHNQSFSDAERLILNWAQALAGQTTAPDSLDGKGFLEAEFVQSYRGAAFFLVFYHVVKLHLFLTAGEFEEACREASAGEEVIHSLLGTIWPMLLLFYGSISRAAAGSDSPPETRRELAAALSKSSEQLEVWAENCPENFLHAYLLVRAEAARLRGDLLEAEDLYARAVDAARVRGFPGDLGLALERCARFWLDRGRPLIGSTFLLESLRVYDAWGAAPKADALGRELARISGRARAEWDTDPAELASGSALVTVRSAGTALDFGWVMKAAGAIASEIDLERLLATLMRTLLESAGAERGCLVLDRDGTHIVRVCGDAASEDPAVLTSEIPEDEYLPGAMLRLVRRTGTKVVVSDAIADPAYSDDPYVRKHRPRSALCLPVMNQGRFLGVVYLENNLSPGAFTKSRLHLLETLSAHAAIAIRNAELFREVSELQERLRAENIYLQEEIKTHHQFEEIIGDSPALMRVLEQVEQVAPTDSTVLLLGETGTGKELLARAIHRLSPRSGRPLVTINCGAISPGLIESELFGHEKGAFTGATSRKIGRFELADRGTILLDEIGDLAPDLQVKLLRVLQEGEIERVGGNGPIRVDVRVIAGTHRNLAEASAEGRFRPDLFYRLNVFPIQSPPLRERREDIPQLVRYFLMKDGARLGKRLEAVPKHTMDALLAYSWPGNVRELRNVVERSIITSRGPALELGNWLNRDRPSPEARSARTLEDVQREHIRHVLQETGWTVSGPFGAARVLGLKPTTLEARMKKLGIERPRQKGGPRQEPLIPK